MYFDEHTSLSYLLLFVLLSVGKITLKNMTKQLTMIQTDATRANCHHRHQKHEEANQYYFEANVRFSMQMKSIWLDLKG